MTKTLRVLLMLGWVLAFGLSLAVPVVLAGGWATVALDWLPVEPRAGEILHLGFTVRQHGVRPISALDSEALKPYLSAQNQDTGDSIQVNARQEGPVGHFVVEVAFPSAGTWNWKIVPDPFPAIPKQLEPLVVLPVLSAPAEEPTSALLAMAPAPTWWLAALALILAAGLLLALRQDTFRWRQGVALGILILAALPLAVFLGPSLISGAADSAQKPTQAAATDPDPDAEYGRALFIAKGCPGCHQHSRVSLSVPGPVIGPNLTDYHADASFVRSWLRDPQAVRPDTSMPDLDLSETEIEALIAFLNKNTQ